MPLRGHAAAVLPYDPERDAVVLIEQFRPGAYAAGVDPWLIEVVAGIIEAVRITCRCRSRRRWRRRRGPTCSYGAR